MTRRIRPFPPPCRTKKKLFGYNYRMIAVEKPVADHLVVVFLRLVIRGDSEYADFNRDPPAWAAKFSDAEFAERSLPEWVESRTRAPLPELAPSLSDTEQTFLRSSACPETYEDVMACEANDWAPSFREQRLADRLIRIPELILAAIDGPAGQVQTLRSPSDERLAIQAMNIPAPRQCMAHGGSRFETREASGNSFARLTRLKSLRTSCRPARFSGK